MASVRVGEADAIEAAKSRLIGKAKPPRFAPAGQSTQMIVGADAARDDDILKPATNLYSGYQLRRVYYSAYSPIPDATRPEERTVGTKVVSTCRSRLYTVT